MHCEKKREIHINESLMYKFKINVNYIYSSILLLYSTFSLPNVAALSTYFIFFVIFTTLIAADRLVSVKFVVYLLLVVIYFLFLSYFHGVYEYYKCSSFLCWGTVSYYFLKKSGLRSLYYIEKTIYFFSCISVVFFVFEVFTGDYFYSLIKLLGFQLPDEIASRTHRISYNIIVYTTNFDVANPVVRNCGIYFEPGLHACFISLAIFLNYCRLRILFNRQQLILLLILITTISTTGFILFLFFVFSIYYFRNKKMFFLYLFIFSYILYFVRLEFVHDKLFNAYDQMLNYEQVFKDSAYWGKVYHPDRLVSLLLAWFDFLQYPLWGRGSTSSSLSDHLGGDVALSSGLGCIIMYYGASLLLVFAFSIIKFAKLCAIYYGIYFLKYFIPLFILLISISYYIDQPVFILFYTIPFFLNYNNCHENNTTNLLFTTRRS